jgi:hypothetical protein
MIIVLVAVAVAVIETLLSGTRPHRTPANITLTVKVFTNSVSLQQLHDHGSLLFRLILRLLSQAGRRQWSNTNCITAATTTATAAAAAE